MLTELVTSLVIVTLDTRETGLTTVKVCSYQMKYPESNICFHFLVHFLVNYIAGCMLALCMSVL